MATSNLTELEKSECKIFLQTLKDSSSIKISTDNNKEFFSFDNHFESFCFCMTHDEIPGELIDIANRYLHFKKCPECLIAPLIKFAVRKFKDCEIGLFELERKDDELKEYKAFGITNAFYQVFMGACLEFLENFDSMTLQKNSQKISVSLQAVRNRRRKMEDRHSYFTDLNTLFDMNEVQTGQALFAVYDGHGGNDAANYAASQLLIHLKSSPETLVQQPGDALHKAIMKTDEEFIKKAKRERLRSGTTAVVVLVQGLNLTVAWLGDSQVVLCKNGNAVQLMDPHKPNRPDERSRIESLGGCVLFFGGWRVNGSLAVSRSIGDLEQKPYITGEPDVEEYEMEGDEEFIILACDGLWDTVEPFDAVQLVRKCIKDGCRDTSANKLVELAIEQRSMDNISILVVFFDFNEGTTNTSSFSTASSSSSSSKVVVENDKTETKTDDDINKSGVTTGSDKNNKESNQKSELAEDSPPPGHGETNKDMMETAVKTTDGDT